MPRIGRIVIPGIPYHITQRGNFKQEIFTEDRDRIIYINLVTEYIKRYDVQVIAYCLMLNHVHFIMVPPKNDSLGLIFNQISRRYAIYFNRKFDRCGHLWQDRYYSCPLDKDHLFEAIRYIENNPVKAGYVKSPELYTWSSANPHLNQNLEDDLLSDYRPYFDEIQNWKEYWNGAPNEKMIELIKKCTLSGRPSGNQEFIEQIEYKTGRLLRKKSVGRPRKKIG